MSTIPVLIGLLAASIVGALTDRLLALVIPDRPTGRHALAVIVAILVVAGGYAWYTAEPEGTVTRKQVQEWTLGHTDEDTVYDVIYHQIHIIPGKHPFTVGETIPAGVLVTTDLGNNWKNYPVNAIVRNGGWGVFETVDSFESPATGEYWLIFP